MARFPTLLLLFFSFLATINAQTIDDYEKLQQWRFSASVTIPAAGVRWSRATAGWHLRSGSVRLMEPLPDGRITGMVFEGEGELTMSISDEVEIAQLRRFAEEPALTSLDERFTKLILRTSDDFLRDLFATPAGPYSASPVGRKRHDHWLETLSHDPDGRIVAALLTPGDSYLRVDMETKRHGWLTYDYDGQRPEEIQVEKYDSGFREVWLSLDRPDHQRADGRPSLTRFDVFDLQHIDVEADLTKRGRGSEVGASRARPIAARFVIDEKIALRSDGVRALVFDLHPKAKLTAIRDESGEELSFLRDHIGARGFAIPNDVYDDTLVVLLDEPASRGDVRAIRFEYELEIVNYAIGNAWYPVAADRWDDRHTATMKLTVSERNEVRAMGRRESLTTEDGKETSTWIVDRPTWMVTFSTAQRFLEESVASEGTPTITAFGPPLGLNARAKVRNVAVDVSNSVRFFQWLFDSKLPFEQMYVTGIAATHGQSFDGFLHLSESTFRSDHPGATELFRAHEVAHQWWGHEVVWKTYRDQWLSEAFAEYSAMMFVDATVKRGSKFFDEILMVSHNIVNGSLEGLMSKFSRPGLVVVNRADRDRIGPIGVGYRAGTREVPSGYLIQTYHKGPLVVHMLRVLLRNKSGNDDLFIAILRDFLGTYRGKSATTDDFQAVVEKHAPGEWDWFFDEWIDRAEIPSFRWSYRTEGSHLAITVRRSGVDAGFIMPIPIRAELEGGKDALITVVVKQEEETFRFPLSTRVKRLIFNPDYSVLASVRSESK